MTKTKPNTIKTQRTLLSKHKEQTQTERILEYWTVIKYSKETLYSVTSKYISNQLLLKLPVSICPSICIILESDIQDLILNVLEKYNYKTCLGFF